jgi:hypothetical protein
MREALFRILGGVFAVPMVFICIFMVFSFPDYNGGIREILEWVSWVGFTLVLTATFSVYAIFGQKKAHMILSRGMSWVGRGNLPEMVFERSTKRTVDRAKELNEDEPHGQLPEQETPPGIPKPEPAPPESSG